MENENLRKLYAELSFGRPDRSLCNDLYTIKYVKLREKSLLSNVDKMTVSE